MVWKGETEFLQIHQKDGYTQALFSDICEIQTMHRYSWTFSSLINLGLTENGAGMDPLFVISFEYTKKSVSL